MKCNLFPAEPGRAGGRRVSLSRPVIGSHGLAHALERVLVMVCVCVKVMVGCCPGNGLDGDRQVTVVNGFGFALFSVFVVVSHEELVNFTFCKHPKSELDVVQDRL